MVYAGTMECYHRSHEVIGQFLNVAVSAMQVHRLTDSYGERLGSEDCEAPTLTPPGKDEVLYVQADGSMILTREQGWKEVKLGRIFKASDTLQLSENRGWISNSQYVAHLGSHKAFTAQLENLIDHYRSKTARIIFVTDGAPWLKNWIEDAYPGSISILDYYHACEYLHAFAREHFKDEEQRKAWLLIQEALLKQGRPEEIVANVEGLHSTKKEAKKLVEYYGANKDRMRYAHYRQQGCGIIGSGAIESAHRSIVQKRMKQAGQRWSKKGAQNLLNLRVVKGNRTWCKVVNLAKQNNRHAA